MKILLKAMDDRVDKTVFILAGYPDEMEQLLSSNPGFKGRITENIHFADFSPDNLLEIFDNNIEEREE